MCISLKLQERYTFILARQESFLSLIKSISVLLRNPFFPSLDSNFSQVRMSMVSSSACRAASLAWAKRPMASTYIGMPSPALRQHWGNDVVSLPPQNLTQQFGLLTCLASDLGWAHQKYDCTVQCINGLRQLDSFNKEKWGIESLGTFQKITLGEYRVLAFRNYVP